MLADDSLAPAVTRAVRILDLERTLHLDVEGGLNRWFLEHDTVGVAASFYYASAHYLLTLVVVVWLYVRHRAAYGPARLALVGATGVALLAYLAMPTAPPRLMDGWTDLLAVHSAAGWWGGEASAPQGLGWLTNQLAAFPSMHAGWALWVALAVSHVTPARAVAALAWAHALVTAVVVVGTGNHWVLDVVAGWAVVLIAWRTVGPPAGVRRGRRRSTWAAPSSRDLGRPALTSGLSASLDRPPTARQNGTARPQPDASRASALRTSAGSVVVHIGGSEALRKPP